jgi:hypothetical protein
VVEPLVQVLLDQSLHPAARRPTELSHLLYHTAPRQFLSYSQTHFSSL